MQIPGLSRNHLLTTVRLSLLLALCSATLLFATQAQAQSAQTVPASPGPEAHATYARSEDRSSISSSFARSCWEEKRSVLLITVLIRFAQ